MSFMCLGTAENAGAWSIGRAAFRGEYDPDSDMLLWFRASCSQLQGPGETPMGQVEGEYIASFLTDDLMRKELCDDICSELPVDPVLMQQAIDNAANNCVGSE